MQRHAHQHPTDEFPKEVRQDGQTKRSAAPHQHDVPRDLALSPKVDEKPPK